MSKQCLAEFIDTYRSEPCLWKVKSKEYHERGKKQAAYVKLVEILKRVEPSANKEAVLKKINNIRSSYRKEVKKVESSSKSGSGTDELYVPKLWYFNLLTFLNDQCEPRSSRSNNDSEGEETEVEEPDVTEIKFENYFPEDYTRQDDESDISGRHENSSEPIPVIASTPSFRPRPPKRTSKCQSELTNSVLQSVSEHFKQPKLQEDRFDVFGKNVAMKLRDLPKKTRVLTEKIINDALFEAEMGTLTASHKILVPPKHNFRIITPSATTRGPTSRSPQISTINYHEAESPQTSNTSHTSASEDSISALSYFQNFRDDNTHK